MGTDQPTPKRRWRPRFSLLTLLLGVLFVGACGGLWFRGHSPWKKIQIYDAGRRPSLIDRDDEQNAALSKNGRWVASLNGDRKLRLFDSHTGVCLWTSFVKHDATLIKMRFVDDDRFIELAAETNSGTRRYQPKEFHPLHVVFLAASGKQADPESMKHLMCIPWAWEDDLAMQGPAEDPSAGQIAGQGHNRGHSYFCVTSVTACKDRAAFSLDRWGGAYVTSWPRDQSSGFSIELLPREAGYYFVPRFLSGGDQLLLAGEDHTTFWIRQFPEYWWGIAWLPEFWIALLSGGVLAVIAARRLRARKAVKQETA